jgi:phenylalanine-4-hydroxylase
MDAPVVELDADHPGFKDQEYRERRNQIAAMATAADARGEPLLVDYTDVERHTWGVAFDKLTTLYPTHACREYNRVFSDLAYSRRDIPQIAEVSRFLHDRTGFRLRPVAGLVAARTFLGALAQRVFCSTQYIRHHSQPLYTPEPDVVHELMGHAPMLAIQEFADLSQKIGEASLKATDAQIEHLATLYWFTIEYGVLRQDGELRAYGAGLLSSFGELEHCLHGEVEIRDLDPEVAKDTAYPITTYQPLLWQVDSIGEAFAKMAAYVSSQGLA